MYNLAKQMILVMGWAVVGAQVVTYAIVQAFIPEILGYAVKIAPAVAAIVAAPVGYAFFKQNLKLAQTNHELAAANEALQRESEIARLEASLDPMTRVFNRIHFVRNVEKARKKDDCEDYFLMLDADNFKYINDTFGHGVGDTALMTITKTMQKTLRDGDIVGRLGGEEFGIYLHDLTRIQAYAIAERLRKNVARTPIKAGTGKSHKLTVSIGAVHAAKEQTVLEIMKLADRNLYRAKDTGRNRVVFDKATMIFGNFAPDISASPNVSALKA